MEDELNIQSPIVNKKYKETLEEIKELTEKVITSCNSCSYYLEGNCEAKDCPYNDPDFVEKVAQILRKGGIIREEMKELKV